MKKIKLLALLSVLISSTMYSDIKLDSSKLQNTTIEQGKRGNTIININTPNGKGISVNDFENFQTKNGVIFNNSGQRMNISQLEGIINGNPNITGDQAKLILNRVNGTNRTEIEGAMEAVGRNKVDMIFSSPNGIYLDGVKFIGFKDVTFTTAPVNLDGDGNIQTLTIDKGNIEVGRKGLDASKLEQLALLSKQISIDGEVKGKNLNFIAGDFDYSVNDKSYIKKEAKNNIISISSSEFGSIYGDQINIIALDGYIGVNGDLIAEKMIKISSAGLAISRGNIIAEEMEIEEPIKVYGNVFVKNYLNSNSVIYNYGQSEINEMSASYIIIYENSNLISNVLDINDGLVNKGFLYVDGFIKVGGRFDNFGTLINEKSIVANHFSNTGIAEVVNVESYILGNSGYIYSKGDLTLWARNHFVNHGEITAKNINITKNAGFHNFGTMKGEKINIKSALFSNYEQGKIIASDNLFLDSFDNHYTRSIENKGLLDGKNMTLKAGIIKNSGKINAETLNLIFKDLNFQGGEITADKTIFELYK